MTLSTKSQWSVGRAVDCDIVIDHPSVSGRHAVIVRDASGRVTLEDLGSRNGVYLDAEGGRKVTTTSLTPGQTIHFGTHAVDVNHLLSAISPTARRDTRSTASGEAIAPGVGRKNSAGRTPGSTKVGTTALWGWVAGAIIPIAVAGWMIAKRSPVSVEPVRSSLTEQTKPDIDEATAESQTRQPEPLEQPRPLPDEKATASIESSIYWLAIHHAATGSVFRLGSGIGIGPTRVAAPATLINSLQTLPSNEFDSPIVIQTQTGQSFSILTVGISPRYVEARQIATQRREDHDALVAKIEKGKFEKAAARQAFEDSVERMDRANEAIQAVNLGWAETQALPSHHAVVPSASHRPGKLLEALRTDLMMETPIWETGGIGEVKSTFFNVLQPVRLPGGEPNTLRLTSDTAKANYNWLGVAVVADGGVIGMIVDQPLRPEATDPNDRGSQIGESPLFWSAVTSSLKSLAPGQP